MTNTLKNTGIILLIIANAGLDQLTKYIARRQINYYETIEILGKRLILTKIENTGAFLSTGDSLEGNLKFVILSFLPLIALCYGIYYLLSHPLLPRILVLGISFVIGGGFGNLYDRLVYGSVTDFIHIDYYFIKTGIFNIADVSIMTGMILIMLNLYVKRTVTELPEEQNDPLFK